MLNLDGVENNVSYLSDMENNKREEVKFLSMVIAEYDASSGLWTFLSDFPQVPIAPPLASAVNFRDTMKLFN